VPRVVADTNIYISAYNFGGEPSKVLELAQEERIRLFISPSILEEIEQVQIRKFHSTIAYVDGVKSSILAFTTLVHPTETVTATTDDGDNRVLACGLAARADYIVSGDKKHLLGLKDFKGIAIVSVKDFLQRFQDKIMQAA
jgi:putative PIN family toxin of toxin-antitoxin system